MRRCGGRWPPQRRRRQRPPAKCWSATGMSCCSRSGTCAQPRYCKGLRPNPGITNLESWNIWLVLNHVLLSSYFTTPIYLAKHQPKLLWPSTFPLIRKVLRVYTKQCGTPMSDYFVSAKTTELPGDGQCEATSRCARCVHNESVGAGGS